MRALPLLLGLLAPFLGPALASAQPDPGAATQGQASNDEQAQHLADEAVDAYRLGKYAEAVGLFKQAYALRADPAILYNLAKCFEKLGQPGDALEYYRRYLVAEGTDPKLRARAEGRVKSLSAAARSREPVPPAPAPPPRRPGRLLFLTGAGIAGAGIAGLIVGVGLFSAAKADVDSASLGDEVDKRTARARIQGLSAASVASYAVGAALLAGGAALVGVAIKQGFFQKERRAGLLLTPLPDGVMTAWTGVF